MIFAGLVLGGFGRFLFHLSGLPQPRPLEGPLGGFYRRGRGHHGRCFYHGPRASGRAGPLMVEPPSWEKSISWPPGSCSFLSSFSRWCCFLFPRIPGISRTSKKAATKFIISAGRSWRVAWFISMLSKTAKPTPSFGPNRVALEFFALSWFAKAHADWTLGQMGKKVFGAKRS